jgi:hypothetical protein
MQTVAWREIRSASRRPATYWARAAAAGIGGAVLLLLMMQVGFGIVSGRTLFRACVWLGFLLCLLEGVRQAATSIVEERAEGTLGLLLLTRVRGAELLLGKFVALAFFALQTLLAVGPIVAMSLLVGGVSGWEVARAALALANTLILALTIGLLISARSREPSRAMYGTFFVLGVGAFLLLLPWWPATGCIGFIFNSLNPFTPMRMFEDSAYPQFQKEFWLSFLITAVGAWLALWFASRNLSASFAVQEAVAKPPQPPQHWQPTAPRVEKRGAHSPKWFSRNPIEWLSLRNLRLLDNETAPAAAALGLALIMVFIGGSFAFFLAIAVFLIFGFLYSAGATMTIARARRSGELELWLTTPLTNQEIVHGQLRAMRKAFAWPGLIMLCGWCVMFYASFLVPMATSVYSVTPATPTLTDLLPFLYLMASIILSIVSLVFAVPYVAMWIALKVKSPAQATMRTFLLMFIAPWLIIGVPKVIIFVPVALVANHSVRKLLENYATRSFGSQRA